MGEIPQQTMTKKKKPPAPIDRGWAWMVLLGALLNLSVWMIFVRSTTILFLNFLERYQGSATTTTLASGLYCITSSVSMIFTANYLIPRFQVRHISSAGSCISCVCVFCLVFAPSMAVVNFLYAIIGISHSVIYLPQITLIGLYFEKHLTFAMASLNLGFSIATCVGPPLIRLLLDEYGLRGALLVMSAFQLHLFVGSALSRPLDQYDLEGSNHILNLKKEFHVDGDDSSHGVAAAEVKDKNAEDTAFDAAAAADDDAAALKYDDANEANAEGVKVDEVTESSSLILGTGGQETSGRGGENEKEQYSRKDSSTVSKLESQYLEGIIPTDVEAFSTGQGLGKVHSCSGRLENTKVDDAYETDELSSKLNIDHVIEKQPSQTTPDMWINHTPQHESTKLETSLASDPQGIKYLSQSQIFTIDALSRNLKTSLCSLAKESAIYGEHGNEAEEALKLANGKADDRGGVNLSHCEKLYWMLYDSAVFYPLTLIILFGGGLGHHMQSTIAYIPALGKENGLSDEEVPYLVTAIGVSDLVSKLFVGWFADKGRIRHTLIACFTQLVAGAVLNLVSLCHSFETMLAANIILGLTIGIVAMLMPAMIVKMLGAERLPNIMSIYYMILGVFIFGDHLVVGLFKDSTGSYYGAYYYFGAWTLVSGLVLSLDRLVSRYLKRKQWAPPLRK